MKKFVLFASALVLFLSACNQEQLQSRLNLELNGLEDLGPNYAYEGWIMVDGSPVSTGTFTVDASNMLSQTSFEIETSQLDAATAFVLSIEPVPDTDPAPSAIKILSGDFSGNSAAVNTGIVGDFSTSSGSFILATPTTTTTDDDLSGVWFLNSGAASLNLPALAEGWAYEGWAVIDGTPVSTGTFTSVDGADDSNMFSGTDAAGPAFPGEDFIMNAPSGLTFPTDLTNMPIVISIEPVPDNSTAPFTLKPLSGSSPASGTVVGTSYDLTNNASMFPSGTVSKTME